MVSKLSFCKCHKLSPLRFGILKRDLQYPMKRIHVGT